MYVNNKTRNEVHQKPQRAHSTQHTAHSAQYAHTQTHTHSHAHDFQDFIHTPRHTTHPLFLPPRRATKTTGHRCMYDQGAPWYDVLCTCTMLVPLHRVD